MSNICLNETDDIAYWLFTSFRGKAVYEREIIYKLLQERYSFVSNTNESNTYNIPTGKSVVLCWVDFIDSVAIPNSDETGCEYKVICEVMTTNELSNKPEQYWVEQLILNGLSIDKFNRNTYKINMVKKKLQIIETKTHPSYKQKLTGLIADILDKISANDISFSYINVD